MTVRYHSDLTSTNFLGSTLMILRWRGSLWKAVYQELILWLIIYAILSCTYAFWLTEAQKRSFEKVVELCNKYGELIPLTFMLGFYVTLVIERWWACMVRLGLIDNVAIIVANHIRGSTDRAKMYRRSIVRYVALIQLMVYRAISIPAKRRYPTLQSIVKSGYLEEHELKRFSENNFWMCIQWALALARKARDENIIQNDFALEDIYKACIDFRQNHIYLYLYSWIPVPLGYTQVVFISVRLYFLVAAIGRQYIASDRKLWPVDTYVPIITIAQFIFYVGWLKVGEALLNPYGNDDDDFDSNWLLKRNFDRAIEVLDEKYDVPPPIAKWREVQKTVTNDVACKTDSL